MLYIVPGNIAMVTLSSDLRFLKWLTFYSTSVALSLFLILPLLLTALC